MSNEQYSRFMAYAEQLLRSRYRRDVEYGSYLKGYLESIEDLEKASEPIPYNYYFS